jgi:DNA-binding response OmpR family regulator
VTADERPRVLVIEDEARISSFLAKGLRGTGWEPVVAEDGAVGLFLATTEPFDAVVLDLGLPDRDGLEVLERIRGAEPILPVVVVTGRDDPASRDACRASGASGIVTKPFAFDALTAELTRHLRPRGASVEPQREEDGAP